MASLVYTATDEYGNDITVRLPDWTGQPLLATTATPPDGTLVADGSEVSREAYAELFAKIGTTYGEGDGVTTFALPDWRDEVFRRRMVPLIIVLFSDPFQKTSFMVMSGWSF